MTTISKYDATLHVSYWFDADDDGEEEEAAAGIHVIGPDLMTIDIPNVAGGEPMTIAFDPMDLHQILTDFWPVIAADPHP